MKKIYLLSIAFILFTGCSYIPKTIDKITGKNNDNGKIYNTKCGVDKCGRNYKDTTFRNYKNVDCCNNNTNSCNCNKLSSTKTENHLNSIENLPKDTPILKKDNLMRISVTGQGVAPMNTSSPAQAYALAKRAAIAEAYRLLAEKIKGVYVEGQDLVKNMMVKRSSVRTSVSATIRNANAVETTFKEGLCEVEMEVTISHSQFI